jgi:(p)ppGpp synthase/HD superfamily hydrolase
VADLPLTQAAIDFARERHRGQRREADNASFVLHPLEVAGLLERSHYPDHVVAAAVLHDVLEDTSTDSGELEARFGTEVSELVAVLTDDPGIEDEDQRKDDVRDRVRRAGPDAAAVYAADKVSKVRELRMLAARGVAGPREVRKLRRHRKSLAMLDQIVPGNELVDLLRLELDVLAESPPAVTRRPSLREQIAAK